MKNLPISPKKFNNALITRVLLLMLISPIAMAMDETPQSSLSLSKFKGIYLGVFGGGGSSTNDSMTQTGIALYGASKGGPLNVNATGSTNSNSMWFGGAHIGYEWQRQLSDASGFNWNLIPAAELEGYYFTTTQKASLINPTTRLVLHSFMDSLPMRTSVFLANGILTLNNPNLRGLQPYVGGGIGTAYISISDANSTQVNPPEPGINHFNSNPNASSWTFAAQGKAGFRYILSDHFRVFVEYRYLYLASKTYTFGSTQYPTHTATTKWKVKVGDTGYNEGAFGVEYSI